MNTGEHLWAVPNGDTPEYIRNHASLQGVEIPNRTARTQLKSYLIASCESLEKKTEARRGPILSFNNSVNVSSVMDSKVMVLRGLVILLIHKKTEKAQVSPTHAFSAA